MKKSVSLRAVMTRINRKLSKESSKLVKNRLRWQSGYGEYSIVDLTSNRMTACNLELEKLAKEEGVLAEHEEIAYE